MFETELPTNFGLEFNKQKAIFMYEKLEQMRSRNKPLDEQLAKLLSPGTSEAFDLKFSASALRAAAVRSFPEWL